MTLIIKTALAILDTDNVSISVQPYKQRFQGVPFFFLNKEDFCVSRQL